MAVPADVELVEVEPADDELPGALVVVEVMAAVAALASSAAPVMKPPVNAVVARTVRMRSFTGTPCFRDG